MRVVAQADDHSARIPEIVSALHMFLERKFLFWLEVLSVLNAAKSAVRALDATQKWLREVGLVYSRNT